MIRRQACGARRVSGAQPLLLYHREADMIWTVIVILLVLWLLGLVSSYTFGGLIHALLVIAIIVFVINLLSRRR